MNRLPLRSPASALALPLMRAEPVPFSPLIFLSLLAVLAESCVMYWLLVRRWTSHRQWVALSDWAGDAGFRFTRREDAQPPAPFASLADADRPRVRLQLSDGQTTLLELESDRPAPPPKLPPDPTAPQVAATAGARVESVAVAGAGAQSPAVWNVLIRLLPAAWPPTALRPAAAGGAALAPFGLPPYPLMGTERFVACGSDPSAARRLYRSHLRALLPPDVGLLLHGEHLVLDFSSRHFDALELTRMVGLAEQLVAHLPEPRGG